MKILGLNVFHADSSASLIIDGKIVSAVEEERFTRIKHYSGFPRYSIDFCLKDNNLKINDIDAICVNFNKNYNLKEKLKFLLKKLFTINILTKILLSFKRNSLAKEFKRNYSINIEDKIFFIPHHISHVASTFYFHKIDEALSLSIDGSGDFSTSEIYLTNKKFSLINKVNYPHSLGIFYQSFTQFLGFRNYGDEYKVMGLASYGRPIYCDRVKKVLKKDENFFKLSLKYFSHNNIFMDYDFNSGSPFFGDLYSENLEKLFGKPRFLNEPITKFHKDLAASFQKVFEDIIINKLQSLNQKYKIDKLCLSGGCIFNSSLNGKVLQNSNFKEVYFSPNPGDAGGAVGAGLYHAISKNEKIKITQNPFLGTYYSNEYIRENVVNKYKKNKKFSIELIENFKDINDRVTECLIKSEGVVGWFQDRMEWGPRALGNRSILGDPRNSEIREIINFKIKRREEFRPFAPSILEEYKDEYFHMTANSPFMSSTFKVKDTSKNKIPGVVHVDGTSRVQTVNADFNKKFYDLILNFYQKTYVPVLLNTSLNVNEPICENPENAFEIFSKTSMDMIVIQNWIFEKNK